MSGTELRLHLADPSATHALGRALGERLAVGQTLALSGDLGAGKTALARGVAVGLGVDDPEDVCSPTYLLLVEHPGPRPMLHLDAYLPEKLRAFLEDGGLDYLLERRGVAVVEWAERLGDLLPPPVLRVDLRPLPAATDGGGGGREAVLRDPAGAFPWVGELARLLPPSSPPRSPRG